MTHFLSEFGVRLRCFMAQAMAVDPSQEREPVGEAFNRLALELYRCQREANPVYGAWCEALAAAREPVRHWSAIPALPVSAFKDLEVTCLRPEARSAVFHSSGTTGQPRSRHFHNDLSLGVYEASLLPWFRAHLLPEWPDAAADAIPDRARGLQLVLLTPSPAAAPRSSLAHMLGCVARELFGGAGRFCGRVDATGGWVLSWPEVEESVGAAVQAGRPVLMAGTAFLFVHLLDELEARKESWKLPPGSRLMETGGYKGRARALPKAELHAGLGHALGVAPAGIVCEYGMSELSSQAYDAWAHAPGKAARRFRFPPWARAQVISPETGREVRDGETGVLKAIDLANVASVLAIQTEDLGVRRGDGFEWVGRAAAAEPRGCSLLSV